MEFIGRRVELYFARKKGPLEVDKYTFHRKVLGPSVRSENLAILYTINFHPAMVTRLIFVHGREAPYHRRTLFFRLLAFCIAFTQN